MTKMCGEAQAAGAGKTGLGPRTHLAQVNGRVTADTVDLDNLDVAARHVDVDARQELV